MRKFVATAAIAVAGITSVGALTAAPAVAATRGGTISTTGAKASWEWDSYRGRLSGRVHDTRSDGKCARVYDRGRNYFLGWGSWKLLGTSCGAGSSVSYGERITVYSDQIEVKVCAGSSPCQVKRIKG
jgi:hypothetical protein